MFRLGQIIGSAQFIRSFSSVIRELDYNPGHLLVTRKNGKHFVFLNAELFQELLDYRYTGFTSEGKSSEVIGG